MAARLSESELIRRQAELSAKISAKGKQASKRDLNNINDIQKRLRLDYKYDYSEAPNLRINRDGELVGRASTFSQAAFTTQQPGIVAQQQTATGAFENTYVPKETGEITQVPEGSYVDQNNQLQQLQTASKSVPQPFLAGTGQVTQLSNVQIGGVPVTQQLITKSQFERAQLLSAYEQNLAARGLSDAQRAEEINRVGKYTVVKQDPSTGRLYLVAPDQSFESIASTEQLNSQTNLLRRVESGTVRPEDIIPVGKQLPLTPENIAAARDIASASLTNAQLLSRPTSSVSSDFNSPLISDIVSPQAFRGTTGYVERGVTPLGFKEGLVEPLKDFASGAKPLVTEFNKGFEAALRRAQADANNNPVLTASFLPAELITQVDFSGSPAFQLAQSGVAGSIPTAKGLKAIAADITSSGFSKTLEGEAPAFEKLAKELTPAERENLKVFAIGALSALAAPVAIPAAVSAFEALPAAVQLTAGTGLTAFGAVQAKESVAAAITDPKLGTVLQAGLDLTLVGLDIGATTKAARSAGRRFAEPITSVNVDEIIETNAEVIGSKVDPLIVEQFQERTGTAVSALARERRITANAVIVPFQVEQFGITTKYVAVVPKKTFAKTFTQFELGSSKATSLLSGDARSASLAQDILFEPYIVKADDLITSGQSTVLRAKPKNPEDLLFAGPRESKIEAMEVGALEGVPSAQKGFGFDEPKLPKYEAKIFQDKPEVIKIIKSQSSAKLRLNQVDQDTAIYSGKGLQKVGDDIKPLTVDVKVSSQTPKGSELEVSEFTTSLKPRQTRASSSEGVTIESADDAFENITQTKTFGQRSGVPIVTTVESRIGSPEGFTQSTDLFQEGSFAERSTVVRSKESAPSEFTIDPTKEVLGKYEVDLLKGSGKTDKRFSLTGDVAATMVEEPAIKRYEAFVIRPKGRVRLGSEAIETPVKKKLTDGVDVKGAKYVAPAFGEEQSKALSKSVSGEDFSKILSEEQSDLVINQQEEIFAGDVKFTTKSTSSSPEAELSFVKPQLLKQPNLSLRTSARSIEDALGITKGRKLIPKQEYRVGFSAATISRGKVQSQALLKEQAKVLKQVPELKSEPIIKQEFEYKPVTQTKQNQFLKPATILKQSPILKTVPETKTVEIQTPKPFPGLNVRTPLPVTPPVPIVELTFLTPAKEKAYNVLVKDKGRFVKVNKNPQAKIAALALGEEYVDKTVAKSFKLLETKGPAALAETGYQYDPKKLRPSKAKGMSNVLVEKNMYAIDSEGERLGITAKGLRARRNKLRPFKIM